ncbi:MAG: hypothetical protein ACXWQO_10490 [Bdellovibrionota bacterium]
MRNLLSLTLALFLGTLTAHASNIEDMLTVKQVQGQTATLEGKMTGLKAGDKVYFARSPFQFTVTAVTGNTATIALPTGSDVAANQTMIRQPTDAMKKAMNTEDKLKKALEE